MLTCVECQCGPTSVASASKKNNNKKDAIKQDKAVGLRSPSRSHQLTSCCTLLLNFNSNHLRFVRRHVYCVLISQLKGSACDPLVYFTRSKISRLFVLVCSRKKKRGRKKRKKPPKHVSLHLAHVNIAITCITLMHCRVCGVSTSPPQTQFDRQETSWHACRQTTNARQQLWSLLSRPCFHLFLRVANYTQAHSHEDRINIITRGSALLQKGRLVTV